jgi:hypothetical protein
MGWVAVSWSGLAETIARGIAERFTPATHMSESATLNPVSMGCMKNPTTFQNLADDCRCPCGRAQDQAMLVPAAHCMRLWSTPDQSSASSSCLNASYA